MKDNTAMEKKNHHTVIASLIVGISFILGLSFLGIIVTKGAQNIKKYERFVTVKGSSEQQVHADFATWKLTFFEDDDDLKRLGEKIEGNKKIVLEYLKEKGIKESDLSYGDYHFTDHLLMDRFQQKAHDIPRYVMTCSVFVKTKNVDGVIDAHINLIDLYQKNIRFKAREHDPVSPKYIFTKLNEIKGELLKKANKNCEKAADDFVKQSGQKVGKLKQARQGVLEVLPLFDVSSEYGRGGERNCLEKIVRVVVTNDYYLA